MKGCFQDDFGQGTNESKKVVEIKALVSSEVQVPFVNKLLGM